MAVFNKHICQVCRPVLDLARGAPVPDSSSCSIRTLVNSKILEYRHSVQSLQQSAQEGCYICTAVFADWPAKQSYAAGGWRLRAAHIYLDDTNKVERFSWTVVYSQDDSFSVHHTHLGLISATSFLISRTLKDSDEAHALMPRPQNSKRSVKDGSERLVDYEPVPDMVSDPLWELMKQWIYQCHERHSCDRSTTPLKYPSRLVQLNNLDTGLEARLISTEASSSRSPYLTLSHRWGSAQFLTLKSSNIHDFYTRILVDDLPLTFQDALNITVRLGYRYLWIDCLCIIQDSEEDWRFESARMGDIYRGSACNVAVVVDSTEHLLQRDRQLEDITALKFLDVHSEDQCRCYPDRSWDDGMFATTLNRRAWVLQERLLAPRIIYFGGKQVYWECCEAIACEALSQGIGPNNEQQGLKNWRAKIQRLTGNSFDAGGKSYDGIYELWHDIAGKYSACDLTKEQDKLIALSGIAKEVQSSLQDEYLAGLWRRKLMTELLWGIHRGDKERTRRPQSYRAPSWSWASIDAPMDPYVVRISPLEELAEIKEASVEAVGDDPTGAVKGGYIHIRGIVRKVIHNREHDFVGTAPVACQFDDDSYDGSKISKLAQPYCMVLASSGWTLHGLLLARTDEDFEEYRRIGVFHTSFSLKSEGGALKFLPPPKDSFLVALDLPKELFHDLLDKETYKRANAQSDSNDAKRAWSREIAARALNHIKPSMKVITII